MGNGKGNQKVEWAKKRFDPSENQAQLSRGAFVPFFVKSHTSGDSNTGDYRYFFKGA